MQHEAVEATPDRSQGSGSAAQNWPHCVWQPKVYNESRPLAPSRAVPPVLSNSAARWPPADQPQCSSQEKGLFNSWTCSAAAVSAGSGPALGSGVQHQTSGMHGQGGGEEHQASGVPDQGRGKESTVTCAHPAVPANQGPSQVYTGWWWAQPVPTGPLHGDPQPQQHASHQQEQEQQHQQQPQQKHRPQQQHPGEAEGDGSLIHPHEVLQGDQTLCTGSKADAIPDTSPHAATQASAPAGSSTWWSWAPQAFAWGGSTLPVAAPGPGGSATTGSSSRYHAGADPVEGMEDTDGACSGASSEADELLPMRAPGKTRFVRGPEGNGMAHR